jgi:hypothetical protein
MSCDIVGHVTGAAPPLFLAQRAFDQRDEAFSSRYGFVVKFVRP